MHYSWRDNLFSSGRPTPSLENTPYGRQQQTLLTDKLAFTGKIGLLFFYYSFMGNIHFFLSCFLLIRDKNLNIDLKSIVNLPLSHAYYKKLHI